MGCVDFLPKQAGSGDPSPENIRPISGYELAVGKNLLPDIRHRPNTSTVVLGQNGTGFQVHLEAGTYKLSYELKEGTPGVVSAKWRTPSMYENQISTDIVLSEDQDIRIWLNSTDELKESDILWYQLEVGDTATAYESPVKTIYGGYLDVGNSEVVETHKYVLLDDPDDWTFNSEQRAFFYKDLESAFSDREIDDSGISGIGHGNTYGLWSTIALADTNKNFYIRWTGANAYNMALRYPSSFSEDAPTLEEIKLLSSNGDIAVVYLLAESTCYKLSYHQLLYNMWVLGVKLSSGTLMESRKRIAMNTPHIETQTGSVATFDTDMKADVKSLKVHFAPVQEGSGDPSPTNVRPITGWSGIDLRHMGENLIKINNFQTMQNNGATLEYLGNNTFRLSGNELTDTLTRFDIPIEPIYWGSEVSYNSYNFAIAFYSKDARNFNNGSRTFGVALRDSSLNKNIMALYPTYKQYLTSALAYLGDATTDILRFALSIPPKDIGTFTICIAKYPAIDFYRNISVDWTNDAGTIYYGWYDLINGELVNNGIGTTINGDTYKASIYAVTDTVFGAGVNANYGVNAPPASEIIENMVCDKLPIYSEHGAEPPYIYVRNNGGVVVGVYVIVGYRTIPEFQNNGDWIKNYVNNWLLNNPVTFYFKRSDRSPTLITNSTLKTLKGSNNIFSDTNGDVEVKYWTH